VPLNPPVADAVALGDVVRRFPAQPILVIGDVMLDHFVFGEVTRISPEAPVPVVAFDREEFRLGGAANVVQNLAAYGARPVLVGVVGDDEAAGQVIASMDTLRLDTTAVLRTKARPTTRKMRIVTTRNQQVARVDYEQDADLTGAIEDRLIAAAVARLPEVATVVVSDYLKGVVTARLAARIIGAATARRVPVLVDPKIPHIDHYRGATLVTPNHHEAEIATASRIRSDEEARTAARAFRLRAGCAAVLITRGEHGMWLHEGGPETASDQGEGTHLALPSVAREVADVTGAGDTVIATMALALAAGATLAEAAQLANEAAGISVSKFGPASVARDELLLALAGR
jgi:D-beta-D-heptose 7-phosphate kinase/D-beta-D-heptose 1-phosphate adenosyltransferase